VITVVNENVREKNLQITAGERWRRIEQTEMGAQSSNSTWNFGNLRLKDFKKLTKLTPSRYQN
jgi:uncharacterized protein YcbK (DUF882 family)